MKNANSIKDNNSADYGKDVNNTKNMNNANNTNSVKSQYREKRLSTLGTVYM